MFVLFLFLLGVFLCVVFFFLLCARRSCLELLNSSGLPRGKPLEIAALPNSPSALSFFFIPQTALLARLPAVSLSFTPAFSRTAHFRECLEDDVERCHLSVSASQSTLHFLSQARFVCENNGVCSLTASSRGNPAGSMCDCFHFH